jgi:hypothetical protein
VAQSGDALAPSEAGEPPVTRRHRIVAYGLVGIVAFCGLARIEAWPLSGFRLFSAVRHDTHESWSLRAVHDGEEEPLSLADLPVAYRNTTRILHDFPDMSPAERDAVCNAWVDPLREDGQEIDELRIYLVTRSVKPGGPPPERDLMWECAHR